MDKAPHMEHDRGTWGSNFGFLMAAVGSAVGLGNIWGFPYKMGSKGGFAFLVIYLLLVVFVGVVVMLGELTIGRKTGLGAVGAYAKLSKKYKWVGYLGVLSAFTLLTFYNVLGGLVMRFMFGFLLEILGVDGFAGAEGGFFDYILFDYSGMIFFHVLFIVCNVVIVMGGIQGGIEKFCTVAMPALFFMLLFVIIYVAFQPGAGQGYKDMLTPNFDPISTFGGFVDVLKTAAGQMFFSLSLGMGAIISYGSYLDKKENLQKNSLIIPACDTLIAVMAACAILPACAAFGLEYNQGPGLLFNTMQNVFLSMGSFGSFVGFMFYFLVFIAAVTSSISLFEAIVTWRIDAGREKGKKTSRATIMCVAAACSFVVGLPVALDALGSPDAAVKAPYLLLGMTPEQLDAGQVPMAIDAWLDFFDVISEGIFMPLGALVMSVLIGWKWKTKNLVVPECEQSGHKFWGYGFFDFCFKFITPLGMLVVLGGQIYDFFIKALLA